MYESRIGWRQVFRSELPVLGERLPLHRLGYRGECRRRRSICQQQPRNELSYFPAKLIHDSRAPACQQPIGGGISIHIQRKN